MEYVSFASGSSGNCALLRGGGVNLLIDAGISTKRIRASLRSLGLDGGDITAILLTHEHSDHVSGLRVWSKHFDTPVYGTAGTTTALLREQKCCPQVLRSLPAELGLELGELYIRAVPLCHDAAQPVGYRIEGERSAIAVLTDLGTLTEPVLQAARGCRFAVAETNHDVELLRHGPYPPALQRRILGEWGHLSNEAGAALCRELLAHGAEAVLLGHLSLENNRPELAMQAVRAQVGRELRVEIAPRDGMSARFTPC